MEPFGYALLAGLVAWAAYQIIDGYHQGDPPPLTTVDDGQGGQTPICAHCRTRLVTLQRRASLSLAGVLGGLLVFGGLLTLLFNWLAGLLLIGLGALLAHFGRGTRTVLTCPACGTDARILR